MAAATLEVRALSGRERAPNAPKQLNFTVPPGHLLAVLGRHGSGKTALMRLLAGFERPVSGDILVDGRSVVRRAAHRRGFGVLQQHDALLPGLTLEENIGLPLALRRVRGRARQQLVRACMELVGCPLASAERKPGQVSPIDLRLALLARAVVFAPPLILLDDPAGQLGGADASAVLSAIRRAHRVLEATLVLASPLPEHVLGIADLVAVLDSGRMLRVAPPQDLWGHPQSATEAAILGRPNLLAGTVTASDADIATVALACGVSAEARAGGRLEPGQACLLAIDPWRIAVAPVSAADMGERAIDATVVEALFQGEVTRLAVLVGSGTELAVMRHSAAGLRGLAPGWRVAIAWEPHHATAFPASR